LVTIPLEVALAGMPGLESCRTKSLFGLSHLRNQFSYSRDYEQAKQDVINRLAMANLPSGVTPQISPASPIGEILRYTLSNPIDPNTGKPVYTLNDLLEVIYDVSRLRGAAGGAGEGEGSSSRTTATSSTDAHAANVDAIFSLDDDEDR
jgi:cobalt-zinc-cadmium resistance protein CzcA